MQLRERPRPEGFAVADAGASMDGGHEGQESEYGEVSAAGLELVASMSRPAKLDPGRRLKCIF